MQPASSSLSKKESLRYFTNFDLNKYQSLNRTCTLPKRFKEKFLSSNNFNKQAQTSNNTETAAQTEPNSQQYSIEKSAACLFKSIKYLEQILLKQKYEIISSMSTAILECILDLYNQIKSIQSTNESNRLKLNLNTSLANFIKWSDSIMFHLSLKNDDESSQEFTDLARQSKILIEQLCKSINELVEYYKADKQADCSDSCSLESKTRSLSLSSSSSTKLDDASPDKSQSACNTFNKTRTIENKQEPCTQITQISTLTSTSNLDFETFLNLDKLAYELSELSESSENNLTSFSNQNCNYLLKQFESFAKEFNLKEKQSDDTTPKSACSTLNRSFNTQTSSSSSPSRVCCATKNKSIVFKNSEFKHDVDTRIQLSKTINENVLLEKSVDETNRNKTSFIQTNYIADKNLRNVILDIRRQNDDEIDTCVSTLSPQNKLSSENLDTQKIGLNELTQNDAESNDLEANFLLIDDEEEDEEEDDLDLDGDELLNENDELVIVEENKRNDLSQYLKDETPKLLNMASFSSESMSDSSLSLSQDNKTETPKRNEQQQSDESNKNLSSISNISAHFVKSTQSSLDSLHLTSPLTTRHESCLSHLKNSSQLCCSSLMSPTSVKSLNQNVLSLLDVTHLLEYQSSASISTSSLATNASLGNSSILRGGDMDALIVLATSASSSVIAAPANHTDNSSQSLPLTASPSLKENGNRTSFLFQEAFLTTYRTILQPIDLVKKLIYRYRLFSKDNNNLNNHQQPKKFKSSESCDVAEYNQKFDLNRLKSNLKLNKMTSSAVRNSLTLLVRVLDGLENELDNKDMVDLLSNFIFELLIDDELQMARLLRKKLLFKLEKRGMDRLKNYSNQLEGFNQNLNVKPQSIPYTNSLTKRNQTILDFKSIDIAEQMTLIDLELFNKIELSEVLLWSTKQNESSSPNLIKFTEHFNCISYWARSRILEPENYKDREKYLIKFLKIMKHLRKMNNFNSYLSILSAVDSGPIQRLDWPTNIIDAIKEFSELIDPKCGFKSLREAISEAQPPCIPHIGLILQDLTILHIANPDYLPSGNCNFWKRWQQFNILERLRYFKRCNYNFKPNLKMQELFNDFKDYIGEDAQYSLSEQLKPRAKQYN